MTARKVISVADAARVTGVPEAIWDAWAARGRSDVPRSFQLDGRRVLFEDEVQAWADAQGATA